MTKTAAKAKEKAPEVETDIGQDPDDDGLGSNILPPRAQDPDPEIENAQREARGEDPLPEPKKDAKGMPKRVWIILEENDDIPPTGLFLSHNGNPFLIRTGEPVHVPEFLLGILDAAITTVSITDPTTRRVVAHRDRLRYSYRRVAAPKNED